jgi:membrane protease YdiL (CAAX protease family)
LSAERTGLGRTAARRNPVLLILLFLAAVMVTAGALAPLLWHGGKAVASWVEYRGLGGVPGLGWLAGKLADSDFGRYFNRAFLFAALGWLWPFLRWMGVTRAALGLAPNARRWRDYAGGFLVAAGLLLAMGGVFLWNGAYQWRVDPKLAGKLPRILMAAVVVPLLEEFLFRGVFLGMAMRAVRRVVAIVLVSGLFAVLHLVKPPDPLPEALAGGVVGWTSGFEMMGIIFRSYGDPGRFVSEFATLLVVGLILAWTRGFTRSLALPMGLHAGWIFGVGMFALLSRTSKGLRSGQWMVGEGSVRIPLIGENLKLGLAPLLVLLLTAGVIALLWRKRRAEDRGTCC